MKGYGAELLDDIETYLGRFVAYPTEWAKTAHVLWVAHTHLMDCWDSTPRLAFLSPEPGSGKSRALEVTEPLVPRPVHAVNVTPTYLFRKVSDEAGAPTILFDEVDTVFGPKAKENEDLRGLLNAGHRKGATAGRCVIRGTSIETVELPAYAAVALAGLGDLPDTVMSRAVVVRMKPRAPHEHVEPFRHRLHAPEGEELRWRLESWASEVADSITWPDIPVEVQDRNADVWEALLSVADAAGEDWPERARVTAVTAVTDFSSREGSLGVLLLRDLRDVFSRLDAEILPTTRILDELYAIEESPWSDLRGKPLDARGLSRRLGNYSIRVGPHKVQGHVIKGYRTNQFADAWARYLPSHGQESVTSVTSVTDPDLVLGGCTECGWPTDSDEHRAICAAVPAVAL